MERKTVELLALLFQACFTLLQALVYLGLWLRQRRPYFATWAWSWGLYALRLVFIAAFIASRRDAWLFAHEAVTWMSSLLLLLAALQFSRGLPWRPAYALFAVASVAWAGIAIFGIRSMAVAGVTSAVMLAAVTLWTGVIFWRHRLVARSGGATLLAVTFTLWGLHRLDYPLLRPLGTGVLFGVFASPGRSNGPMLHAFASAGSSVASGCRNVIVCSAPQRSCCASGSFFNSATARANVSRRSLSRASFALAPNHCGSADSSAASIVGKPLSEASDATSSFGTCGA